MVGRAERTGPDERAPDVLATARRLNPLTGRSNETADILDYMAHVRRKARNNPDPDPLVVEIVEALLRLGGQGHRNQVARVVASARAGSAVEPTNALLARLRAAFDDRMSLDRATSGRPALFDLPLGTGSHRWALAREAHSFLRQGRESRRPSL